MTRASELSNPPHPGAPITLELRDIVTMLGLVALAAVLRLYDLGSPGLIQNEDYLMLCSRAILESGVPVLPSGGFYPRALPFSYATAAMVAIFGDNEIAVRLLPALFSIAAVGLVFIFARRVFGRAPSIIAGLVLALSPWEIMFGRTARMYSPMSFLFLLALYGTYRVAFERADRWRAPAVAAGICACLLHQLGAVLVVPCAVLLVLGHSASRRLFVAVSILLVAVTTLGVMAFENHHYAEFDRRVVEARADERAAASGTTVGLGVAAEGGQAPPRANRRTLPRLSPGMAILVVGVSLAAAGVAWRLSGDPWFGMAILATGLLVGFQQAMLALYAAAAYLIWRLIAGRPPGLRKAFGIGAVLALGGAAWLAVGLAASGVSRASGVLRTLIEYPPNFLEFYARLHPGMSLVVAGAVLMALVGFVRDRSAFAPHMFVVSCFVLPAIGLGFHPGATALFNERYVFYLDSFFVLLYAFGVWRLAGWVTTAAGVVGGLVRRRTIAALVATILLLVTGGFAPAKTWGAARQQYGDNQRFGGLWGELRFVADHQGSSRYVCEHAGPDDLVVPMDILNHWAYCPRADYQLTLGSKDDAEGWIGIRSGDSIEQIGDKFRRGRAPRVWVVLSGYDSSRARHDARLDTMLAFRKWDCASRVYEGRDGASDVWVLDRACIEQHLPR